MRTIPPTPSTAPSFWSRCQGCRQAVDEYLHEHQLPLLLHRIDHTGRMAIKPLVGRS